MTTRQQALAEQVQKEREGLLRGIALDRVGETAQARLRQRFELHGQQSLGGTSILIMRLPDGYVWREDSRRFHRKGGTVPKWRPL